MSTAKVLSFPKKTEQTGGHMADLSNGYTKVANEIQKLKPRLRLSGREWQCFEAVIWLTYGWNKKQDRVTNTVIAELTGLSDTHVSDAIKSLAERKIITSQKQGMMKLVGVNTEISAWILEKPGSGRKFPKTGKSFPKTGKSFPKTGKSFPETVDTQYKNKNSNKNTTSENSDESSDERMKSLPVVRPEAAVHSPKGDKWGTSDDLLAAQWIYSRVQVITPTAQQPNWPAWANDIRLMRDSLKVSHREICEVFTWANGNQFWQTNILSPSKLRKQWATLKAQMSQPARNAPSSSQQQIPHWNDRREWEENFI